MQIQPDHVPYTQNATAGRVLLLPPHGDYNLGRSHAKKKKRSNIVGLAGLPDGQGFFLYFRRGGREGKAVEIMENGIKLARGCQLVSW